MTVIKNFVSIIVSPKFFGALAFLYGIFAGIRDELLPVDVAEKLRLGGLFGVIDWYWWVIGGLIVWSLSIAWEFARYRSEYDSKDRLPKSGALRDANFRFEQSRDTATGIVGITVFNDENVDFTEKAAELTGFASVGEKPEMLNNIVHGIIPHEKRILDWYEKENKIEARGHSLIEVVTVDWEGLHFGAYTILHNTDFATWKVGVEIRGKFNSNPIIPRRCCVTFVVRKHVLENRGDVWLTGWPSIDTSDCNWANTITISEWLAQKEKHERSLRYKFNKLWSTVMTKNKKPKKKAPKKETLTREGFMKVLDKVIGVVKKKSSVRGKKKTSE